MNIIPGNAQHIGARAEQQDAFGFSDIADKAFTSHGGVLAVVADGMGGLANGREASNLAVQVMLAAYAAKTPAETIPAALYRAITEANRAVNEFAHSQGKAGGVGTTLIATVLHGEELHWISAGDSRIYMIRDGRGTQITMDHVYARELRLRAARGEISAEQARNHPEREALTSFLGDREIAEIDRSTMPVLLRPGDRLLLCTDGLYRAVPENEMVSIAVQGSSSAAAEALIARALAARIPNQDNATVALLTVPEATAKGRMLPMLVSGGAVAAALMVTALYVLWPFSTPDPVAVSTTSAAEREQAAPEPDVSASTIQKMLDDKKAAKPEEEKPKGEDAPSSSTTPPDGNKALKLKPETAEPKVKSSSQKKDAAAPKGNAAKAKTEAPAAAKQKETATKKTEVKKAPTEAENKKTDAQEQKSPVVTPAAAHTGETAKQPEAGAAHQEGTGQ